nr:putative ribonuclease H-like domain-containing protein [Tanacetum cinerariifolium]
MQKVLVLVELPHRKRAIGTKWVYMNKKDKRGIVIRNKARLFAQGHIQAEGIGYKEVFAPVAKIKAIRLVLAYAFFMGFIVYQIDVKSAFLYGTIEEEVYVCQPPGFEDPDHPDKVYKVVKALYDLHQAPRARYETLANYLLENSDIIFGATNKDLCKTFKKLMKDKFQMSSMGELTFFLGLQVKQKKDGIFISQDKYVAEILRKFGLTEGKSASTPIDTEKPLLKDPDGEDVDVHITGCSKWNGVFEKNVTCYKYHKCWLPHHTTNGSQFTMSNPHKKWLVQQQTALGKDSSNPLMADNLPKIVNDVTRLQALVDKKKLVVTEAAIREVLRLDDAEGVDCLPNEEIFTKLARMGRKFNFSKYIFGSLLRNVDSTTKFYMYPRFLQLFIRKQVGDLSTHTTKYTSPTLTQKVFANMRRVGKGFFGVETPLFKRMLVGQEIEEEGDADEHVEDVIAGDDAERDDTAAHGEVLTVQQTPPQSPLVQPPSPQPQAQQQAADFPMSLLQEELDACIALARRVEHLEYDERVDKSDDNVIDDESNQGRMIDEIDKDDAVVLMDEKEEDKKEDEPAEVQEVVDVVTTVELITEVVTVASETITADSVIIFAVEPEVPADPTKVVTAPSRRGK